MFYDKFKELCDLKGVSCYRAALDMGLSNATASKWKKTGATPDSSTLSKICTYFNVSIDFLLGAKSENQEASSSENLIHTGTDMQDVLSSLEEVDGLMLYGEPLSDEAKASIVAAMKLGMDAAKAKNKEKFTPKKYRKEDS